MKNKSNQMAHNDQQSVLNGFSPEIFEIKF